MEHAIPEFEQRIRVLVRELGHEETEQDCEENDAEHLAFNRGGNDIRRHHALKHLGHVTRTFAGD